MKKLFIFFIFLIFSKDLYSNQNLIGDWIIKNIPNDCEFKNSLMGNMESTLTINKDRTIFFNSYGPNSSVSFPQFIFKGKINSKWNKFGINNGLGTLNIRGELKNKKFFAKLKDINSNDENQSSFISTKSTKNCQFEFHQITNDKIDPLSKVFFCEKEYKSKLTELYPTTIGCFKDKEISRDNFCKKINKKNKYYELCQRGKTPTGDDLIKIDNETREVFCLDTRANLFGPMKLCPNPKMQKTVPAIYVENEKISDEFKIDFYVYDKHSPYDQNFSIICDDCKNYDLKNLKNKDYVCNQIANGRYHRDFTSTIERIANTICHFTSEFNSKDSNKNQDSEEFDNEEKIQRNITKTYRFLTDEGFTKSEILRLEKMINSDFLFANLISSKICLQRNGMITFVSKEGGCGFGEEINLDQLKKIFRNDKPFKWESSKNANEIVFNEDYNNAKITCTDKDGNVYSRDKSIYKTCDELFEKIAGIENNEFKRSRICMRKNGEFYFIPLEAGCGFNRELSKEEYQILIDENNDNSETNDLYLSIDAILGEWEGTGSYDDNEYPVYVVFGLNSRGELIGRYNYGTKNNHEKGGNLSLLKDDRNKEWKEILKLQRRFAMEWNEGNDNGWFTFQVNGDERILGFWGNDMKTRKDYGGSYSISKISNNIPKLEYFENSNTIEPFSPPNF